MLRPRVLETKERVESLSPNSDTQEQEASRARSLAMFLVMVLGPGEVEIDLRTEMAPETDLPRRWIRMEQNIKLKVSNLTPL